MADLEHIVARHPRLYHMAEAGAWESIQRRGLLSTTALLDLFEVVDPMRTRISAQHRTTLKVICHPEHGRATIRDQAPMSPKHLRHVLTDMEPSEWYEMLNGKVFFWPTKGLLKRFLQAKSYQDRPHDVLTICTRSLVEQYENEIRLSPINSGAVPPAYAPRGRDTFRTIANYCCSLRSGPECFAELAVKGSVRDIVQHTLSVYRYLGATRQKRIWQPP